MSKLKNWKIEVGRFDCPYAIYADVTRCSHDERDLQNDKCFPRCVLKDCPIRRV
jgi:hypothetical protein